MFVFPSALLLWLHSFLSLWSFHQCQQNQFRLPPLPAALTVRLMTFNTWNSGAHVADGLLKIRDQINLVWPDVVALQELEEGSLPKILQLLGPNWSGTSRIGALRPDTGIITRHEINYDSCFETGWALGCQVKIRKNSIWDIFVYSVHLDWRDYGPYQACKFPTSQLPDGPRLSNLQEMRSNAKFQDSFARSDRTPVILLGDFNEPSHLDWTERERQVHCGQTNEWKATRLMEDFGFADSYRAIWPDPLEKPGVTWSTVQKVGDGIWFSEGLLEPQDRIDFIFHRGQRLKVLTCSSYPGSLQLRAKPNEFNNIWPSDHFAVFADYEFDTRLDSTNSH